MKKYKKQFILSIMFCCIPMIIGLILWNQLPLKIATHFNMHGVADGYSSRTMAVLGIPFLMLIVQCICAYFTLNDPKKNNINEKLLNICLWIIPLISNIICLSIYGYALGISIDIYLVTFLCIGVLFIVLGNYMSKLHLNYTVGIKLPWTLNSVDNWNKTHRLAAKLFVLCGCVLIINIFIRSSILLLGVIGVSVIVPIIYSFYLYKKGI